jgi:broad specificity phosphatase PhoE
LSKRIILIRHAKVDSDDSKKMDSHSLKKWVEAYDIAPILADSKPTKETVTLSKDADVVVTSTLRRAIDSASVLGVEVYQSHNVFNEAGIPEVNIPLLKLKPKTWLVILRLMLIVGLGKKDSSLKASKAQAKEATNRLMALVDEHNSVLLVGHGGMNWLLGKELVREGWELEGKRSHENWGVTVFTSSRS